ncbi:MAG: AAA family ATPase, partial [Ottowia sp.]|nr:AAA family ATPase [Ottowia sp.]
MQQPIKYSIGLQDFGGIIRDGYVYVDKTVLIQRLINGGKYYFLSRPRRFGKSLLLSTIAAFFRGEQELFKGLAIEETTAEWRQHPVLHLDLSGQTYTEAESLHELLNVRLNEWEKLYGKGDDETSPALRFGGVIRRAAERTGQQAVILVDEYDKPLLESAGNEALQEHYRATLRAFYSNLKSCDAAIKFALLTGVTKFSKLSVFSDLNNLSDISMQREYAAICGITEGELETYFAAGIAELAQRGGMSVQEARARLKKHYDGYLFHPEGEHVYNPFSLLNTFSKNELRDYWFESGTPSFLVQMMKREGMGVEELSADFIPPERLNALDSLATDPLPILY